jgi:beta-galactosidase/beta-glucuronidase
LRDDSNAFTVNTTVHLRTVAPGVRGVVRVSGDWFGPATVSRSVQLAEAGDHAVTLVLDASNVRLWWPNTWGQQHRYVLNVSFIPSSSGVAEDAAHISSSRKIGFRTLVFVNRQFTAAPAGCDCTDLPLPACCASTDRGYTGEPRLFFRVNGVDMFMRGANFVSVDALESRVSASRYSTLATGRRVIQTPLSIFCMENH